LSSKVSLREYFDGLREADRIAVQAALASAEKGVAAALAASEKAITKAETAAEKRFDLLNELRNGVATREQLEALAQRYDDLKTRLDKIEGRTTGVSASWGIIAAVVGAMIGIGGLVIALTRHG
jgi:hypothetical protein